MSAIAFVVPGEPVPWERARIGSVGGKTVHFTHSRTDEYETRVAAVAAATAHRREWPIGGKGPFQVLIDVYRVRKAGDADNFAKGIKDALTKARVWKDDRYVIDLRVRLFIDKATPRTEITIWKLEEGSDGS